MGLLAKAAMTTIFSLAPWAHLPGFPHICLGPPGLLYFPGLLLYQPTLCVPQGSVFLSPSSSFTGSPHVGP